MAPPLPGLCGRGVDFLLHGLDGTVVAWADGDINTTALLAAFWAAGQACFIRAGVASEVDAARTKSTE
jgi:hypothetical protein